jgi:type IV pilus assembly protein PilN
MKITINLATRPYVELRPIYNRLRTWIVILLLLGGAMWLLYRNERAQADEASARVTSVETHVRDLERLQQNYQTLMQQPKDAAILRQSDFLNGLFRRKAFSWTATMTDLETVLPPRVQVLSIDPIVAEDGHVTIRLRVTGERDRGLDLIRNLERSKHFAAPRLAAESLATGPGGQGGAAGAMQDVSTSNDVNFDILADYRPLPLPDETGEDRTAKDETKKQPEEKVEKHSERRAVKKPDRKKPHAGVEGGKTTP